MKPFIERIRHLDHSQMLDITAAEGFAADRVNGKDRNPEFIRFLGGVTFWLRYGTPPMGMAVREFLYVRPLAVALVAKRQLSATVLSQFNRTRPASNH